MVLTIVKPAYADLSTFSFHLLNDPGTTDPIKANDLSQRFLFTNLFRPLYRFNSQNAIEPDQAKFCNWIGSKKLICELKQNIKWSNGEAVKAQDYVKTFVRLIKDNPLKAESILKLKNAKASLKDTEKLSSIGVKAITNFSLEFLFDEPDADFLFKIANSEFGPTPPDDFPDVTQADKLVVNGPYKIAKWVTGKSIDLVPNEHFYEPRRIKVKVFFVPDHLTAYNLYTTKKLSFLRVLPSELIDKYKNDPEYFETFVARFDHIGLSNTIPAPVREAIVKSLDYEELQKLYRSKGRPGCPGFAEISNTSELCIKTINTKSKVNVNDFKKVFFGFDQAGGSDFSIGAVWFQNQIKKQLGVHLEVKPMERGMFTQSLKDNNLPIFRRAIPLDRPTCLAALETFVSDNASNSVKFNNKSYDKLVSKMSLNPKENSEKKCALAIEKLKASFQVIPLGPVYFAMLKKTDFKGWTLNGLSELDLSKLDTSR